MASKVTVIDTLKQSDVYQAKRKSTSHGKVMSLFFGIYGALASKNIYRNPRRFHAVTMSIFSAVVLGLSLYSFSDFMLFQTSMDMKEDGSSYTDVEAVIPYKKLQAAIKAISDEGLSAMSECQDMTTLLAKELTLGIKSEVEDIADAFKKMAITHDKTDIEKPETAINTAIETDTEEIPVRTPQITEVKREISFDETVLSVAAAFSGKKRKRRQDYEEDPNQISLFDLLAS